MDNTDLNILRQTAQWLADGHRLVLGTITRTWGSAPRPVGSWVAVRDDGLIAGSVSGGCIEDDLIEQARDGVLAGTLPQIVRYGGDAEDAQRVGLPCGGLIEMVLEPVRADSQLPQLLQLLQRLEAGESLRRELDLGSGAVTLARASRSDALTLSATTLTTHHGPDWRLLLIGAGQLSQYVAPMALALGYEVLVCDPREEYAHGFAVAGARLLTTMPDDTVTALRPDAHMAIIALTHDPKLDDMALMEALKSPAFYVGALGSRANQAKRCARLQEHFGVTPEQLARLHGPVGLKNGARTPPEIAVSILAELTAVRYGYRIPEPVRADGQGAPRASCVG